MQVVHRERAGIERLGVRWLLGRGRVELEVPPGTRRRKPMCSSRSTVSECLASSPSASRCALQIVAAASRLLMSVLGASIVIRSEVEPSPSPNLLSCETAPRARPASAAPSATASARRSRAASTTGPSGTPAPPCSRPPGPPSGSIFRCPYSSRIAITSSRVVSLFRKSRSRSFSFSRVRSRRLRSTSDRPAISCSRAASGSRGQASCARRR